MSSEESQNDKEEEKRDQEGLLLEYDVIICGTGLVQSILASALARAGKSVLHCDGSSQYGELDAVWGLPFIKEELPLQFGKNGYDDVGETDGELQESSKLVPLMPEGAMASVRFINTDEKTNFPIGVGEDVQTPYGVGTVSLSSETSLGVRLNSWKLADGQSPVAYFGIPDGLESSQDQLDSYLNEKQSIRSMRSIQAHNILKDERSIRSMSLDSTPVFILASGLAVDGLLASGVAEYMEFKTLEGLFWLDDSRKLSRVPCSKGDVFSTKLLAPMDKRRLMKFMQLSMDYATSLIATEHNDGQSLEIEDGASTITTEKSEEEVQSLNERHLNQGRSLARPQNKAVATEELQVLQQCIADGMSFDAYLSQNHKLSPKLRSLVRYALSMMETQDPNTSLLEGMTSLRRHLQALGRFGTTAFLVPMYGSGELSQAFCRSAAVFGATYLLRRAPLKVVVSSSATHGCDEFVEGVVIRGDNDADFDRRAPVKKQPDKKIRCSHVVVSAESIDWSALELEAPPKRRLLRRISLIRGNVMPLHDNSCTNQEQRHVIVIPPNSFGNSYAIHGILLDSSVSVAPPGCTVLHLTTTTDLDSEGKALTDASILQTASEIIVSGGNNEGRGIIDEVFHVCFSYDFNVFVDDARMEPKRGLHICSRSGQTLTADVAFHQAQRIFSTICPGSKFLGLSQELDNVVKERAADRVDEDDERAMLDSAIGMIETVSKPTFTSSSPLVEQS